MQSDRQPAQPGDVPLTCLPGGATNVYARMLGIPAEIVDATDWQKHSIRGYLSTAAKKRGLKIESTKNEAGDRVYQAKK